MTALLLESPALTGDSYDLKTLGALFEAPPEPSTPIVPLYRLGHPPVRQQHVGAPLLTFTVHQRHVERGRRRSGQDCPVAAALHELLEPAHPDLGVCVRMGCVQFRVGDRMVVYQLDAVLRQAIFLVDYYGYFWGQDTVLHRLYHQDHLPPPFILDMIPLDLHHFARRLAKGEAIGARAAPPRPRPQPPTSFNYSWAHCDVPVQHAGSLVFLSP